MSGNLKIQILEIIISAKIGHVSSFLTNITIFSSNVSFFSTKIGHGLTFSAYVLTLSTKIGYISTLCLTQKCFSTAGFSVAKLQVKHKVEIYPILVEKVKT